MQAGNNSPKKGDVNFRSSCNFRHMKKYLKGAMATRMGGKESSTMRTDQEGGGEMQLLCKLQHELPPLPPDPPLDPPLMPPPQLSDIPLPPPLHTPSPPPPFHSPPHPPPFHTSPPLFRTPQSPPSFHTSPRPPPIQTPPPSFHTSPPPLFITQPPPSFHTSPRQPPIQTPPLSFHTSPPPLIRYPQPPPSFHTSPRPPPIQTPPPPFHTSPHSFFRVHHPQPPGSPVIHATVSNVADGGAQIFPMADAFSFNATNPALSCQRDHLNESSAAAPRATARPAKPTECRYCDISMCRLQYNKMKLDRVERSFKQLQKKMADLDMKMAKQKLILDTILATLEH